MRRVALAWFVLLSAGSVGAVWHPYLVDDSDENIGTAVATWQGIPHIAYYNNSGLHLARWDGAGWQIDAVDPRTSTHNRGPTLVFDHEGQPHIGFYCGTPWHAYLAEGNWTTEQIDTESAGDYISLCYDPAGQLHAAYNKPVGLFNSMLKYAWKDAAGWHTEDAHPVGGYDCVLGFDDLGQPCVVHCGSWSSGALHYSVRTPGGWTHETVLANYASQSFMALDPQGAPHVSYYWTQGGNYDQRYANRVGGIWRFDVVDHGEQPFKRGWDNCIARAQDGSYHISYHAHNELQLRYAHGGYGYWDVEVVDVVGMWNLFSSIALDGSDRAYIAYCDDDEGGALYLATQADLASIEDDIASAQGRTALTLWPNPSTGVLRWGPVGTAPLAEGQLFRLAGIYDAAGRAVDGHDLNRGASTEIDLHALPGGVYQITLSDGRSLVLKRVVLIR